MQSSRLLSALLVSAAIVVAAPFLRSLQMGLRRILPEGYVQFLALFFAGGLLVALGWAISRIRRQWWRYGLLLGALALMALQIFGWNRGVAETDAVERIHFLFYGLVAFLFYRALRGWGGWATLLGALLAVVIVGVLDEMLQWLVPVRTGELFDIVLNIYAGLCGLLFSFAVEPLPNGLSRVGASSAGVIRKLSRLGLVALLLLACFVHLAHLGYAHVVPEIGRFDSYFTLEELARLNEERSRRWRSSPPKPFSPLQIEDTFLTEAGWRVRYRNEARRLGLVYEAWKENLILERYYGAMLELGHALDPAQRRELEESRPRPDPYPYTSPADLGRVFVRPSKPVLWSLVTVLAVLLIAVPRRLAGDVAAADESAAD